MLVYLRERNDKIFKGTSSSAKLIDRVTLTTAKWTFVEFSNFSLNDIIFNWEACMGCGPIKVRRTIFLSSPPISVLRFDMDGVARGKTGPVSTGRVLHNCSSEGFFYVF